MSTLDFSGREQLYYQLYDILYQDIVQGKYEIGSKLPAESELIAQYEVSRATVRKAMEMLANDGLIEKRRGHGTYVIENTMKNSLKRVIRYHKKNEENKLAAFKKVISIKEVAATEEVASQLHIACGEPLVEIKRVRYNEKEPMYYEVNYFEKKWVPALLGRDFSKESLRVFLADFYHVRWSHADQEIYAMVSDEEMASLLEVEKGHPLLFIRRVSYDSSDVPREYVVTYYRAEHYHLEMELSI